MFVGHIYCLYYSYPLCVKLLISSTYYSSSTRHHILPFITISSPNRYFEITSSSPLTPSPSLTISSSPSPPLTISHLTSHHHHCTVPYRLHCCVRSPPRRCLKAFPCCSLSMKTGLHPTVLHCPLHSPHPQTHPSQHPHPHPRPPLLLLLSLPPHHLPYHPPYPESYPHHPPLSPPRH